MDRQIQLNELDALRSIYYEEEFEVLNDGESGDVEAVFVARFDLAQDITVRYKESEESECAYLRLRHLPPVKLHVALPKNYPSESGPRYTMSCPWLPESAMRKLCEQMNEIWLANKNTEIIFAWINFLQSDLLEFLGCSEVLDLTQLYPACRRQGETPSGECKTEEGASRTRCGVCESCQPEDACEAVDCAAKDMTSVVRLLTNYNADREKTELEKKIFTCNICFSEKVGMECLRFDKCEHMFCRVCMKNYFTVMIKEGSVLSLKCPETNCTSEAAPHQVKNLISPELYARYDSLLLNSALDELEGIIYCPRLACQYPATCTPEETLVVCPNCQYPFCRYCKMVYHGIEKCKIDSEEAMKYVSDYVNGSEEDREMLRARFGAKQMQWLVDTKQAESWIDGNCKKCPLCSAPIEKDSGCSKMICLKCNTYFCWECLAKLDPKDPYIHFQYCIAFENV